MNSTHDSEDAERDTRARHQFTLRTLLLLPLVLASLLGPLTWVIPRVIEAREAARRTQCENNLVQHSGFHGLGCPVCERAIADFIRGDGYPSEFRLRQINMLAKMGPAAASMVPPLVDATQDEDPAIRAAALAALEAIEPDATGGDELP